VGVVSAIIGFSVKTKAAQTETSIMKNDTVEQITPRSASKSVLPATGRQDSDLSWLGLLLSGLSLSGLWTRKKKTK
jgi:LPXTG-motif cell wall-anchored protein